MMFEGPYDLKERSGASDYDVAEDGRFVMIHTEASSAGTMQINLAQNWFQEFERLVPILHLGLALVHLGQHEGGVVRLPGPAWR